jgi:hypothetical protein
MTKIVIRAKYPKISYVLPYRLSEPFNSISKESRISAINANFSNIQRWADARRNYNS